MVPVGPGEAQLPVCLLHTGVCTGTLVVGFSLTNKNPDYMGLTLMEHFVTRFPIFSHTKLLILFLFRIILLGLNNNFVSDTTT